MAETSTPVANAFVVPISAERAPSSAEMNKWTAAKQKLVNIDRYLYLSYLYMKNISMASTAAKTRGMSLSILDDMTEEEQTFLTLYSEYATIKSAMREVQDMTAGLRPSNGDFDIVQPDATVSGPLIIGAAIAGVVLVSGLIARLVYLEVETQELSDEFNGVMDAADKAFCVDPNSENCQFWEQTKKQENYQKNVTMADTVKSAVATVGKGAGMGLLIAIPLIAYSFFKR